MNDWLTHIKNNSKLSSVFLKKIKVNIYNYDIFIKQVYKIVGSPKKIEQNKPAENWSSN